MALGLQYLWGERAFHHLDVFHLAFGVLNWSLTFALVFYLGDIHVPQLPLQFSLKTVPLALTLALSPGQTGDGPAGPCHLIMDRAYQGDETLQLALELGFTPVVPPNPQRLRPWEYDRAMYRKRKEVERLFRRLKGFRRIFSRFDKLDVMFMAFVHFALIFEALR